MSKVLYIEDEPALAELVRRKLQRKGYEVVLADEGPNGLELADTERPDVILLDINLGCFSFDGFEMNRRLKSAPATRAIPVIALTAHADWTEHRDKAEREGFVAHVTKPIDFELLLQRIALALSSSGNA